MEIEGQQHGFRTVIIDKEEVDLELKVSLGISSCTEINDTFDLCLGCHSSKLIAMIGLPKQL